MRRIRARVAAVVLGVTVVALAASDGAAQGHASQTPSTSKVVALKKALAAWYANAHQIAQFLSKANPSNWPLSATTQMMNNHLKLTTNEAVAHLKGKWSADIAAYDGVRAEILMMADTLANGIVNQFPEKVA